MLKRVKKALFYFLSGVATGIFISRKPEALTLRVNTALVRKQMSKRWGDEQVNRIITAFRKHYGDLPEDDMEMKGVMKYQLEIARQGLALYRALSEELGRGEDPVEVTHQLMWDTFMKKPSRIMGSMMANTKDPFDGFAQSLAWTNAHIFPEPYWRRTDVDFEDGVGIDYTGCFYYDYFKSKGVPELTKAFCEMDIRQAECFPPQIEFQRKETLPTGHDRCDFRYYKRD